MVPNFWKVHNIKLYGEGVSIPQPGRGDRAYARANVVPSVLVEAKRGGR